jgi:PAS domain S-box-containing protein
MSYMPRRNRTRRGIELDLCANPAVDVKRVPNSDLSRGRDNFAAIFHASPTILSIIRLDDRRYLEINKVYELRTGYSRSEVVGKPSLNLGLWNSVQDREQMFEKLLAKGRLHCRQRVFRTKTGEPLTTSLSAEIIEFAAGPCALVIAEDVSMHRRAEEARLDLAQRLINAQEAESSRIGRELHDNIGQSIALFTLELESARLALPRLSPDNDARLDRLYDKLKALGRDVGNLSHQLHSSRLELLGLAVAAKILCREFSERYDMQVPCTHSGVPDNLSDDVSLCLFRVLQEALHNVAKHSLATKSDVELIGTNKFLHLRVSDDGIGFAPNTAKARSGLGLISMRERLHLIGGDFVITTKPGSGTLVEAIVPMAIASRTATQPRSTFA